MGELLTVPNAWTIHAKGVGRIQGAIYRTRQAALAAIQDRIRNGHAFEREKPCRVKLLLRWDGNTMHAVDVNGR